MAKSNGSLKKALVSGIIAENPVFVSLLGMCPTLATTKSVESAFGMGILVLLTLIGSNFLISLLRKLIPEEVKIPCYIVIIATFVTIIKMLCNAFVPALYDSLGVFISLIVVNCIILGRAEAFASKNGPVASIMDAIGSGVGFTMALCIIAFIREFIGKGSLSIGVYFTFLPKVTLGIFPQAYAIDLFQKSAGGFLTLAIVLAIMAAYKGGKEAKKAAAEKARIEELKAKKAAELAAKKAAEEEAKKAAAATPAPAKEAPAAEKPAENPAPAAADKPVENPAPAEKPAEAAPETKPEEKTAAPAAPVKEAA